MSVAIDEIAFEDEYETPCDFTEFLDFATQLNIPLNENYLCQLKAFQLKTGGSLSDTLTVFEHGLKGQKYFTSESSNERRLQNALWRVWWSQRRARYHATPKTIPDEEDRLVAECPPEARTTLVRGEDIRDVPTEYTIPALRAHELPVIGTYVDKHVVPGFAFRIRLNGSDSYLFGGEALVLERIGQGYGKRLTFESEDLINNENFFWSDSNPGLGFGFSIQVVFQGDKFSVFDSADRKVAQVAVNNLREEQEIVSSHVEDDCLVKEVCVLDMECEFSFCNDAHVPQMLQGQNMELPVSGVAVARKQYNQPKAKLFGIKDILVPLLGTCSFQTR